MKEISEYIQTHGKRGLELVERYIDLQTPVTTVATVEKNTKFTRRKRLEICQVCHFSDTGKVELYGLDNYGMGWMIEWNDASKQVKRSITKQLKLN